jgi:hypothetical protein
VGEVGKKPSLFGDDPLDRLDGSNGQLIRATAALANQMDVIVMSCVVIRGPRLEMSVRQDPHVLEEVEGSIDRGVVDTGEAILDPLHQGLRRDVASRPHDLRDNCAPLGRHAVTPLLQFVEHLLRVRLHAVIFPPNP